MPFHFLILRFLQSPESMSQEGGAVADIIAQCEGVFEKNEATLKVRVVSTRVDLMCFSCLPLPLVLTLPRLGVVVRAS